MKPNFDLNPKPAPAPSFIGGKGTSLVDALKAQQDASAQIGVIRSPSVPTQTEIGPQSLNWQQITIPAGQKYPVQLKGDFIYIEGFSWFESGSVWINNGLLAGLTMKTDTLQTPIIVSEAYRDYRFPTPYGYIEFENRSTIYPVTVQFWSGFGEIRRDRNDVTRQVWTQAAYIGPVLAISKNHYITSGPILFSGATSRYVQSAVLKSASIVKSVNTTPPGSFVLWLFAGPVPSVTVNQSADISTYTLIGPGFNILGAIQFAYWQTGDTTSTSWLCQNNNLNIPIYSNQTVSLNPDQFTIWGYLTTNDNYTSPGNDLYDITLEISYS